MLPLISMCHYNISFPERPGKEPEKTVGGIILSSTYTCLMTRGAANISAHTQQ
jgi:hypothetical protein